MTIYEPPNLFNPTKGISTSALYLKGPKDWQTGLIKKLCKLPEIIFLKASKELNLEWELDSLSKSEVAVFNFSSTTSVEDLLLLTVRYWSQFPPDVLITYNGNDKYFENYLFHFLNHMSKAGKLHSLNGLEEKVVELFAYLKDIK